MGESVQAWLVLNFSSQAVLALFKLGLNMLAMSSSLARFNSVATKKKIVDLKGGNTENTTAAPNGINKAFKHQATRLILKRYPCMIRGKTLKLKSSKQFYQ